MEYKYPDVECLERHAYAPEMNRLHMNSGIIHSVPGCTTIADAITYVKNRTNANQR